MPYDIKPNVRHTLSELVGGVISASGQVREKEHWISVTTSLLYRLEIGCVERSETMSEKMDDLSMT